MSWSQRLRRSRDAAATAAAVTAEVGHEAELAALRQEVQELRLANDLLCQGMLVDYRTGLANAAAFTADQLQLHALLKRSHDGYSVIVADLDRFEELRSQAGGTYCEAVIGLVAETLSAGVRRADRAYWIGPDRYSVLLPGTDRFKAIGIAQRLRARIETLAIEHPWSPTGALTTSVAAVEAGYRHGGPADVMAELEDLLTAARMDGGNRAVWSA